MYIYIYIYIFIYIYLYVYTICIKFFTYTYHILETSRSDGGVKTGRWLLWQPAGIPRVSVLPFSRLVADAIPRIEVLSTCLRSLVPKTIKSMVLEPETSNIGYLDPLEYEPPEPEKCASTSQLSYPYGLGRYFTYNFGVQEDRKLQTSKLPKY